MGEISTSKSIEPATNGQKSPDVFHGWMAVDATSPLRYQAFEPKPWAETDVDIKISHCGVCASDLHTMRSGWVSHFPLSLSRFHESLIYSCLFKELSN